MVKATIVGSTITCYINGAVIFGVTDSTYSSGNPGMGFYLQDGSGPPFNYGFSSYTASDDTQTPTPTPTPGRITLTARGYKVRGRHTVDLSWTGATSSNVDIYRNGVLVVTTLNDRFYTDSLGGGGHATYTYKVCNAGSQTCSDQVTVTF